MSRQGCESNVKQPLCRVLRIILEGENSQDCEEQGRESPVSVVAMSCTLGKYTAHSSSCSRMRRGDLSRSIQRPVFPGLSKEYKLDQLRLQRREIESAKTLYLAMQG